jgi:FlaA1/EpsC-like NDP-sugar epimerase
MSAVAVLGIDRYQPGQLLPVALLYAVTKIIVFIGWKLYDPIWRYTGTYEIKRIVVANATGSLIAALVSLFMSSGSFFVVLMAFFVDCVAVSGSRLLFQRMLEKNMFGGETRKAVRQEKSSKVLIVGAGAAGVSLLEELQKNPNLGKIVVALADDDPTKWGRTIKGVRVAGKCDDAGTIAREFGIEEIIIAMPSVAIERKKQIMTACSELGCKLQTLPGLYELINGSVSVNQVREVGIEDLLGRDEVVFDSSVEAVYRDKVIMITGGGGSIGSEICRQLMRFQPRKVVILDVYENNAYDLEMEMKRRSGACPIEVAILSVCDRGSLEQIFHKYRPEIIFHAAAHKHVPFMESWPKEAILNNVFGTFNVAELAVSYGVRKFILVSTDKAVRPTNVMGTTKRICEKIIQAMNRRGVTEFAAVRFGNVLGSNGSVIPLFAKQIREGGPVTVTHPDIIRYFMTIPEAAKLVIEAGGMAKGGEVFILDMGEPVKIKDLAERMITLSGFKVGKDIAIKYTGLRPGEKLYEELLLDGEGIVKTLHKKIFVAKQEEISLESLEAQLSMLRDCLNEGDAAILAGLKSVVPEYTGGDAIK